ncbi:MAG: methyltransferase domain-containing protein [Verrucomicrobia bacterium]|nr:methyltransferase domain-containing protein [Verrucomicrobiota bacterium]
MFETLDPIQQSARAQFDRQSANYGKSHILADTEDVVAALRHVPSPSPGRSTTALDVATGGGHTGILLASLGYAVTLADISENMLARASALAAERGLSVQTRQHPAEALPYADASFDLVTCRIAPHHFSSPESFVRESARVLRLGGHFLLIDGSIYNDAPEVEAWLHEVEKLRDPSHHRLLSPRAWERLCHAAGLRVIHQEMRTLKQPDLEWYFAAADTPPDNRRAVRELIAHAPDSVRATLRLQTEPDSKIVWHWPRLTLVATKP